MAKLVENRIIHVDKSSNSIHEDVTWSITTFNKDGHRYLQIDTYGKENRKYPDKVSQSIQFDRKMAKYLIQLIIDKVL